MVVADGECRVLERQHYQKGKYQRRILKWYDIRRHFQDKLAGVVEAVVTQQIETEPMTGFQGCVLK